MVPCRRKGRGGGGGKIVAPLPPSSSSSSSSSICMYRSSKPGQRRIISTSPLLYCKIIEERRALRRLISITHSPTSQLHPQKNHNIRDPNQAGSRGGAPSTNSGRNRSSSTSSVTCYKGGSNGARVKAFAPVTGVPAPRPSLARINQDFPRPLNGVSRDATCINLQKQMTVNMGVSNATFRNTTADKGHIPVKVLFSAKSTKFNSHHQQTQVRASSRSEPRTPTRGVDNRVQSGKKTDGCTYRLPFEEERTYFSSHTSPVPPATALHEIDDADSGGRNDGVDVKNEVAHGIENLSNALQARLILLQGKANQLAEELGKTKQMLDTNHPTGLLCDIQNKITSIERALVPRLQECRKGVRP